MKPRSALLLLQQNIRDDIAHACSFFTPSSFKVDKEVIAGDSGAATAAEAAVLAAAAAGFDVDRVRREEDESEGESVDEERDGSVDALLTGVSIVESRDMEEEEEEAVVEQEEKVVEGACEAVDDADADDVSNEKVESEEKDEDEDEEGVVEEVVGVDERADCPTGVDDAVAATAATAIDDDDKGEDASVTGTAVEELAGVVIATAAALAVVGGLVAGDGGVRSGTVTHTVVGSINTGPASGAGGW